MVIVAVVASVLLIRPGPSSQCEPLDPISVVISDTHFSIPAVLLPALRSEDEVEITPEYESLSDRQAFSDAGTQLRRWYCASKDGSPLRLAAFVFEGRWVAEAVKSGEVNYDYLPGVGNIIVNRGQMPILDAQSVDGIPFFSGSFHVNCGEEIGVLDKNNQGKINTLCSVKRNNLTKDTTIEVNFTLESVRGNPVRNAPEDWPKLAREIEQLVQSIRVPAD